MTGPEKRATAQPANCLDRQSGMALLLALVVIIILTAFSLSLVLSTQSETQMGNTIAAQSQAYYAALAGLEEARARLNPLAPEPIWTLPQQTNQVLYLVNSSPQDPVDPTNPSSPYYDYEYYAQEHPPSFSAPQVLTSVASDQRPGTSYVIPYKWVRITLETEYASKIDVNQDGFLDQTTPIYWDGANQYLGTSPPCTYPPCVSPVYMLTALAVEPNGVKKMLQAEVVGTPPSTLSPAGVVGTAGSATLTGSPGSANLTLNGNDYCGVQNLPGIAAGSTPTTSGLINIQVTPPEPLFVSFPFTQAAITNIIQSVLPLAVPILNADPAHVASVGGSLAGTNVVLGQLPGPSSPGQPVVVYANQSLAISGPASTGYGLLLVNGNLSITDGFFYQGLIVSNGTVTITTSASGNIQILGSLTSSGGLSINSSASPSTFVQLTYDSCAVPNAIVNSFQSLPLRIRSFKDLSF